LTAGVHEQKPELVKASLPNEPSAPSQSEWHFRVTSKGEIEHYRGGNGKVGVREAADKIHILERSDEAFVVALERAQRRFGQHLHFNGSRAGVERLVNIVLEKDRHVTFTDVRITALCFFLVFLPLILLGNGTNWSLIALLCPTQR
jgi:hypothetical protein